MAILQENTEKKVRAVVLAAGFGKRMKSDSSKVLHSVLGKPIIWRLLKAIDGVTKEIVDLEQIHVVIGHNAEQVEGYVQECVKAAQFSCPIFFHKQENQLGTGHALMSARGALDNFGGEVLVLPGDTPLLTSEILDSLFLSHNKEKSDLTILSTRLSNPYGYGRVLRSEQGEVLGIIEEKDASEKQKQIKEISASIYCFNWSAVGDGLSAIKNNNKQGEYYLTDLVSWSVNKGLKIEGFLIDDSRIVTGVNSRFDLQLANQYLNEMVIYSLMSQAGVTVVDPVSTWIAPEVSIDSDTVILPGCWLVGDIQIGKSCIVGPHTVIEGKTKIGDETKVVQSHLEDCEIGNTCYVGPFAHLRAGSKIANQVRIGNFVEIKNSNVDSLSAVGHLSYIGDSTIGKDANIGAGTITANYDHTTKIKAATHIEDGASIGSNSVLVAPVNIGKESVIAAGTVITKDVEAGALAVRRVKQENIAGWSEKRKQQKPKKT